MNWEEKFLQGVFSEPDGKPSFTRCVAGLVTAFSLGWLTAIITHNIRQNILPVFPDFGGLIGFVSIFYGINQVKTAISSFTINRSNGNGQGS